MLQFSQVNIDEPLFQPFPSEVYFQNFEPFEIYQVPLILRNNDKVSVYVCGGGGGGMYVYVCMCVCVCVCVCVIRIISLNGSILFWVFFNDRVQKMSVLACLYAYGCRFSR